MQDCTDSANTPYQSTTCLDTKEQEFYFCEVDGLPSTDCKYCTKGVVVPPGEECPLQTCWDPLESMYEAVECSDDVVVCLEDTTRLDCKICEDPRGWDYQFTELECPEMNTCYDVNGDAYDHPHACPDPAPLVCYSNFSSGWR